MVSEGELSGLLRVDASADLSSAREATLRDALGAAREQPAVDGDGVEYDVLAVEPQRGVSGGGGRPLHLQRARHRRRLLAGAQNEAQVDGGDGERRCRVVRAKLLRRRVVRRAQTPTAAASCCAARSRSAANCSEAGGWLSGKDLVFFYQQGGVSRSTL